MKSDLAEYEANWFALAFLMPEKAVRDAWTQDNFCNCVPCMATKFRVPESIMRIRLQSLHLLAAKGAK